MKDWESYGRKKDKIAGKNSTCDFAHFRAQFWDETAETTPEIVQNLFHMLDYRIIIYNSQTNN